MQLAQGQGEGNCPFEFPRRNVYSLLGVLRDSLSNRCKLCFVALSENACMWARIDCFEYVVKAPRS